MNHGRAARERSDKSNHEIDGMIRRQNAEITHAGPERVERRQRHALLQVIIVRQNASFGTAACARRIHDARRIFPFARDENRFA